MPILVIQHSDRCKPGRLGRTLRDHAFKLHVVRPDKGEAFPPNLDDIDAVISLGGPQAVGDKHAWIGRELDLLRAAHEANLPVVGVCLGHQFIAAALGGEVAPMDAPEVGFTDVNIRPQGHTDTILSGIAWNAPQFQRHKYEVTQLPPGATLLASSEKCNVQAFRAGMRTYAFQYHFEADHQIINDIMSDARTDLHQAGATTDEFTRTLTTKYDSFARLADRLCINIATYLIPKVANTIRL